MVKGKNTALFWMLGTFAFLACASQLKGYCDRNTEDLTIPAARVVSAEPVAKYNEIVPTAYTEVHLEGYADPFAFPYGADIEEGDSVYNVHARCGAFSKNFRVKSFEP